MRQPPHPVYPGCGPASSFALGIVLAYPLGTLLAAVCAAWDVYHTGRASKGRRWLDGFVP